MPLEQEFDGLEWAALNNWADRKSSGRPSGGPSSSGKARANLAGSRAVRKNKVGALVRSQPGPLGTISEAAVDEANIAQTLQTGRRREARVRQRRIVEREPGVTEAVGRGARILGTTAKGALFGIGARVLGPVGAVLAATGPIAFAAAVAATGVIAIDLFLSVEERKLFARRAIKPDEVFEEFGIKQAYSTAWDEIGAISTANFQLLTDIAQGDGWMNAAGRYTENLQRNRNILPHPRMLEEIRDMRQESLKEIQRDNFRQGGLKRQGLNGG